MYTRGGRQVVSMEVSSMEVTSMEVTFEFVLLPFLPPLSPVSVNIFDYVSAIISYSLVGITVFSGKYDNLKPSKLSSVISEVLSICLSVCLSFYVAKLLILLWMNAYDKHYGRATLWCNLRDFSGFLAGGLIRCRH